MIFDKCEKGILLEKRWAFLRIVPRQLASHMHKSKSGIMPWNLYKNELKMDHRPKYKM